jgi:23S rRNA (uracil1939-C5)-methyltransferase
LAKRKKTLPVLEALTISDVAAEGKALARVEDMVVFVPFSAPGDVVDVQLTKKKRSYAEGRVVRVHSLSDRRETPFCAHFGVCGGCKWQHLPYADQLHFKQKQVYDALTRIGKVDLPAGSEAALNTVQAAPAEVDYAANAWFPIFGSQKTRFYRNKLEYTFSDKRWMTQAEIESGVVFESMDALGFHIPGMFDKVLDIERCWLQDDISNRIRLFVRGFCQEHHYPFFNLRNQEGLMRNLMIRTSSTGELMVVVVFYANEADRIQALLQALSDRFPEITSLVYVINQKCNDTIGDQEMLLFKGREYILESMEGLQFKVGPKSFYQTNSEQALQLYRVARAFAGLTGDELVYDLYTGTGTIAQFIAKQCRRVVGLEYVPEAIEDAKANAILNGLDNTAFFAGDMKDLLNEAFLEEHGRPEVIVTDPPRAGMHDDVIKTILLAAPSRIVYVSCNPATQARDLALLDSHYEVTKVQPVDLFPHTQHVENVVLLVKRSEPKAPKVLPKIASDEGNDGLDLDE